jgi:RNA-directed DNA polymerase
VENRQRDFAVLTGTRVVRYADDFIITCRDRDKLEGEILDRVTAFLKERGLTISAKKTKIVDLKQDGFKFPFIPVLFYRTVAIVEIRKGIVPFLFCFTEQ